MDLEEIRRIASLSFYHPERIAKKQKCLDELLNIKIDEKFTEIDYLILRSTFLHSLDFKEQMTIEPAFDLYNQIISMTSNTPISIPFSTLNSVRFAWEHVKKFLDIVNTKVSSVRNIEDVNAYLFKNLEILKDSWERDSENKWSILAEVFEDMNILYFNRTMLDSSIRKVGIDLLEKCLEERDTLLGHYKDIILQEEENTTHKMLGFSGAKPSSSSEYNIETIKSKFILTYLRKEPPSVSENFKQNFLDKLDVLLKDGRISREIYETDRSIILNISKEYRRDFSVKSKDKKVFMRWYFELAKSPTLKEQLSVLNLFDISEIASARDFCQDFLRVVTSKKLFELMVGLWWAVKYENRESEAIIQLRRERYRNNIDDIDNLTNAGIITFAQSTTLKDTCRRVYK